MQILIRYRINKVSTNFPYFRKIKLYIKLLKSTNHSLRILANTFMIHCRLKRVVCNLLHVLFTTYKYLTNEISREGKSSIINDNLMPLKITYL